MSSVLDHYKPRKLRIEVNPDVGLESRDETLPVDMNKLEHDMTTNRLDEIASHARALTYGEMIQLGDELFGNLADIGDEQVKAAVKAAMPMALHKWATAKRG